MAQDSIKNLARHAAGLEKKAFGGGLARAAKWLNPAQRGISRTGRLGRLAAAYGGYGLGETAVTSLGGLKDLALGDKTPDLDILGQNLRGYGDDYKPPTDAPNSWGINPNEAPAGDMNYGKLLGSSLLRPSKTIATVLGGYGGADSPRAYEGPTRTSKKTLYNQGPGGKTTRTISDETTEGIMTPKGRYEFEEMQSSQALLQKRKEQLLRDIKKLREHPEQIPSGSWGIPRDATAAEMFRHLKVKLKELEDAQQSGDFGGNYAARFGSEGSPANEWGLQGQSQTQLQALMDERMSGLSGDVNVKRTPEWAGRQAAFRQQGGGRPRGGYNPSSHWNAGGGGTDWEGDIPDSDIRSNRRY